MRLKKQYISARNTKKILQNSDIYTLRRIAAKDRGFNWGQSPTKSIYDLSLAPYNNIWFMKYRKFSNLKKDTLPKAIIANTKRNFGILSIQDKKEFWYVDKNEKKLDQFEINL